jgi:hypothetical protein
VLGVCVHLTSGTLQEHAGRSASVRIAFAWQVLVNRCLRCCGYGQLLLLKRSMSCGQSTVFSNSQQLLLLKRSMSCGQSTVFSNSQRVLCISGECRGLVSGSTVHVDVRTTCRYPAALSNPMPMNKSALNARAGIVGHLHFAVLFCFGSRLGFKRATALFACLFSTEWASSRKVQG